MTFKEKNFLLVIFRIVIFLFIIYLNFNFNVVYAFSENTIKGTVIGVSNGSEILIKNNGVEGFSLIIKNTEKEFNVKDFVSEYYEVLDTANNNIYLKDATKVDFKYYILNLNNNSINEIKAPHKKFETALIKKLLKGETISDIKYYEHFCDKDGTLWFRFKGTLYDNRQNKNNNYNNDIRSISGIGTSDGRYIQFQDSIISSFCKGNNDDFYAIEYKELRQTNGSLKQLTNIINIDKGFSKKTFSIPYKEEYKNCNILIDKDNIIHLVSNYFVNNETIKSLRSYKLAGGNLQLINLSDMSKNIIDATLDNYGKLWILLKGELKKVEKGSLKTYEKVDISFEKISVYDENNIILSNKYYDKDSSGIKTTYLSMIKGVKGPEEKVVEAVNLQDEAKTVSSSKVLSSSVKDRIIEELNYKNLIISVIIGTIFSIFFLIFVIRKK